MNEYIKTGDIVSFEDNYIPNSNSKIPIYVKTYPAKTEEEKAFYEEHREWYEKEIGKYKSFKYDGYICKMKDIQNGTICYDVPKKYYRFYRKNFDSTLKRYTICSYKRDEQNAQYLIQNINGILVWRYFKYNPTYFKLNTKHGYYEVFRICFKDDKSWIEDRIKINNYNVPYLLLKGKLHNGGLQIFNNNDIEDIITEIYPILKGNISSFTNLSLFCIEWNKLYKNGHIFKNVPQNIFKDLKLKGQENKIIKRSIMNNSEYWISSHITICRALKDSNIIVFSTYNNNYINLERIYVSNDKIYKFGWDSIHNCWVSTLRKQSLYSMQILNSNIYKCKNIDNIMNENKICNYAKTIPEIIFSQEYLWYEQGLKQGFKINPYEYMNLAVKLGTIKIDKNNFTKSFKNIPLHELLGIPSSALKYIKNKDNSYNFYDFKNIMKTYHIITKRYSQNISDIELRFYLAKNIKQKEIITIINKLKKNNIDVSRYLRNLLKHDNYKIIIDMLMDYWKFIKKANSYNIKNNINFYYPEIIKPSEIAFMHDKAFRDYQRDRQSTVAKTSKKFQEKFYNVIASEAYLSKLYNNNRYSIINVKNPNDLDIEGATLHHCVASYKQRMSNNKSYIYFLRKNDNIDIPYATIEIIPPTKTHGQYINQCYTQHDTLLKEINAKKFVKNWCKINNIDINCEI